MNKEIAETPIPGFAPSHPRREKLAAKRDLTLIRPARAGHLPPRGEGFCCQAKPHRGRPGSASPLSPPSGGQLPRQGGGDGAVKQNGVGKTVFPKAPAFGL